MNNHLDTIIIIRLDTIIIIQLDTTIKKNTHLDNSTVEANGKTGFGYG